MFSESKWITFQISHRQNPESSPSRPGSWSHHSQLQDNSFSAISYYLCCDTHYSWYLFVEEHHTMLAGNSSTQYALAKVQKLLLQKQKCSTPLAPFIGFLPCKLGRSEHPATNLFQGRIYRGKNPKQCSQYFFVIKNLCSKYVAIS